MWEGSTSADQVAALGRLDVRFADEGLEYWVFGDRAVDLHAGVVTRAHDDVDVAVWAADADHVARALELDGWTTVPRRRTTATGCMRGMACGWTSRSLPMATTVRYILPS